ncbi:hypothetical protein Tco_1068659, partial [Tanacetum coccineum]
MSCHHCRPLVLGTLEVFALPQDHHQLERSLVQIDLQKQVVQFENELESDLDDEVPDLEDVVEKITDKIARDSSIAMFCYEK